MKKRKGLNEHHKIPKSRKHEGFDVQAEENREILLVDFHSAIHRVFANDLPHEQIERLIELNRSVFREEFLDEIEAVLEKAYEDMYADEVLKVKNKVRGDVNKVIDFVYIDEEDVNKMKMSLQDEEVEELKQYYRNNAPT